MTLKEILVTPSSLAFVLTVTLGNIAAAQSDFLRVDAFGYHPTARKLCLVRSPEVGFDQAGSFTPGAVLHVRRSSDDAIVYSGSPMPWNGGAIHGQSGDRVHRFDFSAVAEPGTYYIEDPSGERTEDFEVLADVFASPRRSSLRAFYYQRCGTPKAVPFADSRWTDSACHVGPDQDHACLPIGNPGGLARNLWGGWHDAGDYNKYINFADGPLHELLGAYSVAPHAWDDASGIPESGNGLPDILDECRFELEWFLRMQIADGSVLHKVSVDQYQGSSPPSSDQTKRWYAPATASATASACSVFARASLVFAAQPGPSAQAFAVTLEDAARNAWSWLTQNPSHSNYDNAGFLNAAAEDSPAEQAANRVIAAAWLAQLTGEAAFHSFVAANYDGTSALEFVANQGGWVSPYQFTGIDALLSYAQDQGSSVAVSQDILASFRASLITYWTSVLDGDLDAYAAWLNTGDHGWGSNRTRSTAGTLYARMAALDLEPCNSALYRQAALGHAHWLHGANPLGITYLTNMLEHGAPNSAVEPYHRWFADGTVFDGLAGNNVGPAPGLLVGGANINFSPSPSYTGPALAPPMDQPAQKSFRDWNTDWPQNSWEITEPSIVYQGAYVRLMAELTPNPSEPLLYCPAPPNSSGQRAHIRSTGSGSIGAGDLSLEVSCAPGQTFGIAVYGLGSNSLPLGQGVLCVANPQRVLNPVLFALDGSANIELDLGAPPFNSGPGQISSGDTWMFQVWFRETSGPQPRFHFTDAIAVPIVP